MNINKRTIIGLGIIAIAIIAGCSYYYFSKPAATLPNSQRPGDQQVQTGSIDQDIRIMDQAMNSVDPADFNDKDLDSIK